MVLVLAFADGVQAGDVGLLVPRRADVQPAVAVGLVVDPQPAHRVVDGGEDFHRHLAGVGPLELLVDFQDAGQLAVQHLAGDVGHVEVDAHPPGLHAQAFLHADLEDLAGADVAGHEVAVLGIALFEEVVAFLLGNVLRRARDPAASAAPTRGRPRRGRFR